MPIELIDQRTFKSNGTDVRAAAIGVERDGRQAYLMVVQTLSSETGTPTATTLKSASYKAAPIANDYKAFLDGNGVSLDQATLTRLTALYISGGGITRDPGVTIHPSLGTAEELVRSALEEADLDASAPLTVPDDVRSVFPEQAPVNDEEADLAAAWGALAQGPAQTEEVAATQGTIVEAEAAEPAPTQQGTFSVAEVDGHTIETRGDAQRISFLKISSEGEEIFAVSRFDGKVFILEDVSASLGPVAKTYLDAAGPGLAPDARASLQELAAGSSFDHTPLPAQFKDLARLTADVANGVGCPPGTKVEVKSAAALGVELDASALDALSEASEEATATFAKENSDPTKIEALETRTINALARLQSAGAKQSIEAQAAVPKEDAGPAPATTETEEARRSRLQAAMLADEAHRAKEEAEAEAERQAQLRRDLFKFDPAKMDMVLRAYQNRFATDATGVQLKKTPSGIELSFPDGNKNALILDQGASLSAHVYTDQSRQKSAGMMVEMAIARGWKSIEMKSDDAVLMNAIWLAARNAGFSSEAIQGPDGKPFSPSMETRRAVNPETELDRALRTSKLEQMLDDQYLLDQRRETERGQNNDASLSPAA